MSCRSARVLEQLAVVGAEPVQLLGLVEELERELGDLARVLLGDVAAAGEALHRRPPDRARVVGPVGGVVVADGVEHDALAQRPLADGQLVEVEQLHRGREEHRAGGDEVDAPGLEALEPAPLRRLRRR